MSKKAILIGSAVLVLLAGGGAAYFMLGAQADAAEPEPDTVGIIELEPFLTNVNDGSGRRHARVHLQLTVSPQERAEELSADKLAMARLRDQVLTQITSKSFADLTSPEGKQTLRREIMESAAPIVAPGKVQEALFSELIVQ